MSDKLKMHKPNKADENYKKLAARCPNAVTETIDEFGEVVRAIDKDILMQEISTTVVEGKDERYQFTWPDKKKSILLANAPINKTLRPCREESVNFDSTENLYIEGDNLEVLKLLQETYLGKIKMIYIDPPYNTGNDFVYEDDFEVNAAEWNKQSGEYDENGMKLTHGDIEYQRDEKGNKKLVLNSNSNGRFHTDWLNMIYPRLKIAKDLLTDDGVIFISIDDNEQENLEKICNEIFGENNKLSSLVWNKQHSQQQGIFKKYHETVFVYARNSSNIRNIGCGEGIIEAGALKKISKANPESAFTFPSGVRFDAADGTEFSGTFGDSEKVTVVSGRMIAKDGKLLENVTLSAGWTQKNQMEKYFSGEDVIDSKGQKVLEFYFNSAGKLKCTKERSCITPPSILPEYGMVSEQSKKLASLLDGVFFDNPKPIAMMEDFAKWFTSPEDLILDFFSGSATTAHAVMQLNAEDGGNRKFIMVQLPEETDEKSEAYKANYKTICEIGKERIRRAAKKIAEENPESTFDGGFRVLKCESSNMKDVYYNPQDMEFSLFSELVDNIKEDRTPEDLLFQVMLDLGVLLSSKIEESTIGGKKVFNVAEGFLIACFDADITEEVVTEIAKQKPYYFVTRDNSMANDNVATNFEQIFATYSPDTVRKVL